MQENNNNGKNEDNGMGEGDGVSEEVRVQYTLGEEEITRVYLNHCISRGWKPATKKRPTHQSSHKVLYNELEEEAKEKDERVKRNV